MPSQVESRLEIWIVAAALSQVGSEFHHRPPLSVAVPKVPHYRKSPLSCACRRVNSRQSDRWLLLLADSEWSGAMRSLCRSADLSEIPGPLQTPRRGPSFDAGEGYEKRPLCLLMFVGDGGDADRAGEGIWLG